MHFIFINHLTLNGCRFSKTVGFLVKWKLIKETTNFLLVIEFCATIDNRRTDGQTDRQTDMLNNVNTNNFLFWAMYDLTVCVCILSYIHVC